jgi:hypothetical protein
MRRSLALLITLCVAAGAAAFAQAGTGGSRYVVTVGNQGAGGDPGVLYVGGPANFTLRDRQGADRAFELCVTPAPLDQPSCRRGRTNKVISGPAFSAAGETRVRFTLDGGTVIERTVEVATPAVARKSRPYRLLAAVARFSGPDAGAVVRLNRSMPVNGEDRPPVNLGPGLIANEVLPRGQRFYGGITPSVIGRRDRHCYLVEVRQLVPRTRLRDGGRVVVGISLGHRIVAVAPVILRPGGDMTGRTLLRGAGC